MNLWLVVATLADPAQQSYLCRVFSPENIPNIALVLVGIGGIVVAAITLGTIKEQTVATAVAANAAKASADGFIHSERAWVMAELGWYEKGLHVVEGSSQNQAEAQLEFTTVFVKLTCRNAGRSPAWIDNVFGRVDRVNPTSLREDDRRENKLGNFGTMGPIGPGEEKSRSLELICYGHCKEGEFLSAYVVVEYRDIFGIKRTTTLGYSIRGVEMNRQDGLRDRNKNT
jgi:hypothetical protein